MKGDTTVREELREFEAGWVPWVLAASYFPVYVLLDFLAGDLLASRLGLPQSVAVGLVSLTVAGLVVVAFVAASLRHAAPRPGHGLGGSRGSFGRPVWRLLAPLTRAVLVFAVVTRDTLAALLVGTWRVVAWSGGVAYRVLSVVLRPVAFLARTVAWPVRAVAGLVGGRRGDAGSPGDLDEPIDRSELEADSTGLDPALTDGPAPAGDEPSTGGNPWPDVDEAIVIDSPVSEGESIAGAATDETPESREETAESGETTEAGGETAETAEETADAGANLDEFADSGDGPDEVSDGGPAARGEVPDADDAVDVGDVGDEDGADPVADDPFDDADEDGWPEGWISASDV